MRCVFPLLIVATLLTACQKQDTPPIAAADISKMLAYPDAEVVSYFTTKTGGVVPTTLPVVGNTSHPTDQPANLTFRGSTSAGNIDVSYVCYGRFSGADIYAFSVGTNDGKKTMPLNEVACVFKGQEMLVLETNGVKITIKRK